MNKKLVGIVVVAVLLFVGGGVWLLSRGKNSVPTAQTNTEATMPLGSAPIGVKESSDTFAGKFADILGLGRNMMCEFQSNEGDVATTGVVYVASGGDRVRGDFTMTQSGAQPIESHMIRDGEWSYVWSSTMAQGIKTKITDEDRQSLFPSASQGAPSQERVAPDPNVSYDCDDWNGDASKFDLPAGVEFVDFDSQLKALQSQIPEAPKVDASVCEQLPAGPAREQCLGAANPN